MDIKKLILTKVKNRGWIKSSEIVKLTGYSRVYINRFFKELVKNGQLELVGKANQARYLKPGSSMSKPKTVSKLLKNKNLQEDLILEDIKKQSSVFKNLSSSADNLVSYAFTEMLNNAIEHSRSPNIKIQITNDGYKVVFTVRDYGIGVFKNVQKKFKLKNEIEAVNHLLKGKQTTIPKIHSGEGIFFTSKAADNFIIDSFGKRLVVDNLVKKDIWVKSIKPLKGTRIIFSLSIGSKKNLLDIFAEYAGKNFEFSKTKVLVKLGLIDNVFLSRSQARRIIFGLDKFKHIILDFKGVDSIGQSFADEIFRVWQNQHQNISIHHLHANDNVLLMINRTKAM